LITSSLDSTIKIRQFSNIDNPNLLYDHEEGVLSLDVGHEDGKDFLVSIDVNRWIVLRDMDNPRDIMDKFQVPV